MPRFSCPARPPWWKTAAPAAYAAAESGPAGRWLLSVAVIAVTGAVKAVTGAVTAVTRGRDPGLNVSGTVLAVTAMAGG